MSAKTISEFINQKRYEATTGSIITSLRAEVKELRKCIENINSELDGFALIKDFRVTNSKGEDFCVIAKKTDNIKDQN